MALNNAAALINPQLNGVTINGAPSGPNQALISTSPTAAAWEVGAIQDYDTYTGFSFVNVPPPFTQVVATIPTGGLQQANLVGSYVEGELLINNVSYTGSAPRFALTADVATQWVLSPCRRTLPTTCDFHRSAFFCASPAGEMNVYFQMLLLDCIHLELTVNSRSAGTSQFRTIALWSQPLRP